eukprot:Pgem_evm1s16511
MNFNEKDKLDLSNDEQSSPYSTPQTPARSARNSTHIPKLKFCDFSSSAFLMKNTEKEDNHE